MKKSLFLPVYAVIGDIIAFILRLLQNRSGFDAATGLPIRGNLFHVLLPLYLLLFAASLLVIVLRQSKRDLRFPRNFVTENLMLLTVAVCGVFLMGVSGALELVSSFTGSSLLPNPDGLVYVMSARALQTQRIGGALSVLIAVGLFPAVVACRKREEDAPQPFNGSMLLIPAVCLVVRLVLCYREHSTSPIFFDYYLELLTLVLLILGFYRLSSFAFGQGRPRLYAFYTAMSVVLALANFADGMTPSALLCLGGALVLVAFLLFSQDQTTEVPAND